MITQSDKRIIGWDGRDDNRPVIIMELINDKWTTTYHANPFKYDKPLEILLIQAEVLEKAICDQNIVKV